MLVAVHSVVILELNWRISGVAATAGATGAVLSVATELGQHSKWVVVVVIVVVCVHLPRCWG